MTDAFSETVFRDRRRENEQYQKRTKQLWTPLGALSDLKNAQENAHINAAPGDTQLQTCLKDRALENPGDKL